MKDGSNATLAIVGVVALIGLVGVVMTIGLPATENARGEAANVLGQAGFTPIFCDGDFCQVPSLEVSNFAAGRVDIYGDARLQNVQVDNLRGLGNAYACVNANGLIFRSNEPCV